MPRKMPAADAAAEGEHRSRCRRQRPFAADDGHAIMLRRRGARQALRAAGAVAVVAFIFLCAPSMLVDFLLIFLVTPPGAASGSRAIQQVSPFDIWCFLFIALEAATICAYFHAPMRPY